MKNILLITCTAKGTISSCSYNLYKALVSVKNYNIYVYSLDQCEKYDYPFENIIGGKVKHSGIIKFFYHIKNLRQIKNIYDIELSISTLTAFNAYNLFSSIREKKIGIYHAPISQSFYLGWYRGICLYILSIFTIILTNLFFTQLWSVSQEALNSINSFSILKRKNIIMYNIHYYDEILKQASLDFPRELQNKKYFVYVGSIYELKGWDRLLRAFSLFCITNKEYYLVVCGSFWDNKSEVLFWSLLDQLKINKRVIVLGYQPNPYSIIKKSKALVSSSYTESLPGVLIEALSLGVPILSTNSSIGVWEIFGKKNIYDQYLNHMEVFKDGIITSNNKKKYSSNLLTFTLDDKNLANAMAYITIHNLKPSFNFRHNCEKNNAIKAIKAIL